MLLQQPTWQHTRAKSNRNHNIYSMNQLKPKSKNMVSATSSLAKEIALEFVRISKLTGYSDK